MLLGLLLGPLLGLLMVLLMGLLLRMLLGLLLGPLLGLLMGLLLGLSLGLLLGLMLKLSLGPLVVPTMRSSCAHVLGHRHKNDPLYVQYFFNLTKLYLAAPLGNAPLAKC